MTVLTRATWLFTAAVSGLLVTSVLHVHFAGPVPFALLAAIAVLTALRPVWGLTLVAALMPFVWYTVSQFWNAGAAWPEALACAALTGLGVDACRARDRVPRLVAAPACVCGAIVLASLCASLNVMALRDGPVSRHVLWTMLTRDYFVDSNLTALHTALLLLEGLLLFAHGARLGMRAGVLRTIAGATAAGAAVAGACTVARLLDSAWHRPAFVPALLEFAGSLRWNVHYRDWNAAGSFFALALLTAAALAWTSRGRARAIWILCAASAGIALWLTSSRVALVAVPAAAALALLLPRAIRGRRQAVMASTVALAAAGLLLVAAIVLPQRGIQKSTRLAADVRVGLIETGLRMMHAYPAFGVGLGGFHERSGEFSSPELIAAFPVAVHENAHNNFIQVAAETGIAGGIAFIWTLAAALLVVAWRATSQRDRFLQLVFAALAAFVLTMIGGHPLLVAEPGYALWILAGTAAGDALGERADDRRGRRATQLAVAAVAAVVLTLPMRLTAATRDVDLEHVGVGVSSLWHVAPDDMRYREATGAATLFVPQGAFRIPAQARTTETVQLEVKVDGRVANVFVLPPNRWVDIVIPARTVQSESRFRRMDLRTIGGHNAILWLGKDEPVAPH